MGIWLAMLIIVVIVVSVLIFGRGRWRLTGGGGSRRLPALPGLKEQEAPDASSQLPVPCC